MVFLTGAALAGRVLATAMPSSSSAWVVLGALDLGVLEVRLEELVGVLVLNAGMRPAPCLREDSPFFKASKEAVLRGQDAS